MTLRVGRISFANMAPAFFDLSGVDIVEVPGVPTTLNRMLLDGEIDVAPMSSIEYARNAGKLRLLPQLCVSAEGAIDSIQLITRKPLDQVKVVAVTPESATSVVLTKVLLGEQTDHRAAGRSRRRHHAHRRCRAGEHFEDPTPHHDLSRLWQERTGLPMVFAVWGCRAGVTEGLAELEQAHLRSLQISRDEPEALARRAAELYGWPAGFMARYYEKLRYHFGPREREGLLQVLRAGPPGRRARCGARAGIRRHGGGGVDGGNGEAIGG